MVSIYIILQPALLLINATDLKSLSKPIPIFVKPPKYTQAQLDVLEEELKPTLDFRYSEKGISQRN